MFDEKKAMLNYDSARLKIGKTLQTESKVLGCHVS